MSELEALIRSFTVSEWAWFTFLLSLWSLSAWANKSTIEDLKRRVKKLERKVGL